MAKINDLPLLSNPTKDMFCLVGKGDLQKVPWSVIMGQIGSPYIATTVAGMTDKTRVYVYQGSESGYTSGNWYYWNGSAWTSGGVYNSAGISTDTSLTASGQAADAKTVGDKFNTIENEIKNIDVETDTTLTKSGVPADSAIVGNELKTINDALKGMSGSTSSGAIGFTEAFRNALSEFMDGVAYIDANGQTLKENVLNAMNVTADGKTLQNISVTYTGGAVSAGTTTDSLIGLTVTAHYSDGTSTSVLGYTLSPSTIQEGANTITVTYGGKTATFSVTGKAASSGVTLDEAGELYKKGKLANDVNATIFDLYKLENVKRGTEITTISNIANSKSVISTELSGDTLITDVTAEQSETIGWGYYVKHKTTQYHDVLYVSCMSKYISFSNVK